MLGLAKAMLPETKTVFASFSEDGLNREFLEQVRGEGFKGVGLKHDTPRLLAARNEVWKLISDEQIAALVCHGYKAATVGWFAARKSGIPAIAVSRGWTAEDWKVRLYEVLDRFMLKRMDRVVCVSNAQATKVAKAGVMTERIHVIHNSIVTDRFQQAYPEYRDKLLDLFSGRCRSKIRYLVGAAGRLSPEKGFDILVEAAAKVVNSRQDVGFVVFGDGVLGAELEKQIDLLGVADLVKLAGFTKELDRYMPQFDLFVQSSHTEGLPNVLLESLAAGVPVIATNVGGTSEVLNEGKQGKLVPANDPLQLSESIKLALADPSQLQAAATVGKKWVNDEFNFSKQASNYATVLQSCLQNSRR